MDEKIKYIKHDKYLEVIFTGERSSESCHGLIEEIHNKCKETNLHNVLINIREAKGDWKEFDRFKIGQKISECFTGEYKILVIEQKDKINKFAENTAVNRGANVLITYNQEKNLPWLLEDDKNL